MTRDLLTFQPHQGVSKSPDLLRNCGAFQQLQSLGHEITDFGNVASDQDEARNPEQVLEFNRKVGLLFFVPFWILYSRLYSSCVAQVHL